MKNRDIEDYNNDYKEWVINIEDKKESIFENYEKIYKIK